MNLYHIEYSIISRGQKIICHSVGVDQNDVIKDIVSVVGAITIMNLYKVTEVHRISGSIREQIVQNSTRTKTTKKIGRPRKHDMMEMRND
jgi:uncharacterized membrane protein YjjP (DUF1212 family)